MTQHRKSPRVSSNATPFHCTAKAAVKEEGMVNPLKLVGGGQLFLKKRGQQLGGFNLEGYNNLHEMVSFRFVISCSGGGRKAIFSS